jgi:hypothetical protein
MIDYDEFGMAVRPFYNQEGDEYSILFPLSAWNPKNGDGWVLTGFWGEKHWGVIPICASGKSAGFATLYWWGPTKSGVGPAWWRNDASEYGVFPIFANLKKYQWLFPLYYTYANGGNKDRWYVSILWPLSMFESKNEKKKTSWIFPLYVKRDSDKSHLLLTPLYSYGKSECDGGSTLIWTPLFSHLDKKDAPSWYGWLTTLYHQDDWREGVVAPLLSWWKNSDTAFSLNILGRICEYRHAKKEGCRDSFLLWPVIDWHANSALCAIDWNGENRYGIVPPLGYTHAETSSGYYYRWRFSSVLPKKRLEEFKRETRSDALLGMLFHDTRENGSGILPLTSPWSRHPDRVATETTSRLLGVLYQENTWYKVWDERKISLETAMGVKKNLKDFADTARSIEMNKSRLKNIADTKLHEPDDPEQKKALEEKTASLETKKAKLRRELWAELDRLGVAGRGRTKDDLFDALVEMDEKYSTTMDSQKTSIPLILNYERDGENVDWNVLLLLARYSEHGDSTDFDILKYLVRYAEREKGYSLDVFPFVNVTEMDDRTEYSLAWRLFRFESETEKTDTGKKERNKLYLLFVPVWSW